MKYANTTGTRGITSLVFKIVHNSIRGLNSQRNGKGCLVITFCLLFYSTYSNSRAGSKIAPLVKKVYAKVDSNKIDLGKYILGVQLNGEAKAIPLSLICYYHMLCDTVGGKPIMFTYCVLCRSARAFSTIINGKAETFRLKGVANGNAVFEDESTRSTWQQETGEAINGALKGKVLDEIPSEQMTLRAWIALHPTTLILQDEKDPYDSLALTHLDRGDDERIEGDSASWEPKSWIIGVVVEGKSKAYDWLQLKKKRIICDDIGMIPIAIMLDDDTMSFHAFRRDAAGDTAAVFTWNERKKAFSDIKTRSIWSGTGECLHGILKGARLIPLPCYQEYWDSWKKFHPETDIMN